MRKFVFALLALALTAGAAMASNVVPGDVLVVMENPSGMAKVSAASLAGEGEHGGYVASVASSLGARAARTFVTLSEETGKIFTLFHSDTESETELLARVMAMPGVKGASLNYISKPLSKPNDRYWNVYPDADGLLWGMRAINAGKVWDTGHTGSESVYVAVIDTGIDTGHPDLAANIAKEYCMGYVLESYNLDEGYFEAYPSNLEKDYQDLPNHGHGTHTSGTIGAIGNNGIGVVGVNWNTKIIMLRAYLVLDNGLKGFPDEWVIDALESIYKLKKSGVNIAAVNLSLGGWDDRGAPEAVSNSSNPWWSALKLVSDAGVVICVAAGNESQRVGYPAPCDDFIEEKYKKGEYVYPASYRNIPNMIVVAAASQDIEGNIIRSIPGPLEAWSNYGSEYVDIAAPGSCVVSTVPRDYVVSGDQKLIDFPEDSRLVEQGVNEYASWPGTSMATPHVAGAAALLKSAYPEATGAQIKRALLDGANEAYCKNDRDSVSYDYADERADERGVSRDMYIPDDTSRCGFLDVKGAFDLLPEIMAADAKRSHGGCDAGVLSGAGLLGLGLAMMLTALWIKRRVR